MTEFQTNALIQIAQRKAADFMLLPIHEGTDVNASMMIKNAYFKAFLDGATHFVAHDFPKEEETKTTTPTDTSFGGLL